MPGARVASAQHEQSAGSFSEEAEAAFPEYLEAEDILASRVFDDESDEIGDSGARRRGRAGVRVGEGQRGLSPVSGSKPLYARPT